MSFQRFYQPYFKTHTTQERTERMNSGLEYGYYLVRTSDSKRFYISKVVDVLALEQVADTVLSDATGWDYWIDRSMGADVAGKPQWVNFDQTDKFL